MMTHGAGHRMWAAKKIVAPAVVASRRLPIQRRLAAPGLPQEVRARQAAGKYSLAARPHLMVPPTAAKAGD